MFLSIERYKVLDFMGSKKLQVWLPAIFAIVLSLGMYIGYQLREQTSGGSSILSNEKRSSLQEILGLIKNKYVDKVKIDSLQDNAVQDVLYQLDPHSVFIPARELEGVNEDLQGNFQGIGVEFQIFSDTVNVVNVVADGPSFRAGVQIGDKIIKVNDTANIAGKNIDGDGVRKLLRGPGGSKVSISVLRDNQIKKIVIERGIIPLPSLDAAYMLAKNIGYIRMNKFSESTFEEFMQSLEKLQKLGMQKLMLDLRGNGGGFMNEAVDMADEFLSGSKLIVYTQGAESPKAEYNSKRDGLFETGKLIVLVDETSASASEILAGALQDWDRAIIIGRRTFGKGLVQQQFPLSDGSALRLTTARYYTPLGRNIQKPYNKGHAQYEEELMNRYNDGELLHGDTAIPKGPAFKTPGGRLVYGGGGITPDIFVPFDTAMQPQSVVQLYLKNILSNFVYSYYIHHKKLLQTFKTPGELYEGFKPGEQEWLELVSFSRRDSVDISGVTGDVKIDLLERMQALTARQIWRTEGYFEVANKNDLMIIKALEEINR